MVDCTSVTFFAAIGALFLGYKALTLLKTLYDVYIATGIPVRNDNTHTRIFITNDNFIAQEVWCWPRCLGR